ncbi:hypothetical protein AU192_24730 [Mycobacterium lehmannii]|uniref:4Fe-4S Wbl-type domain-containing protein n=1 Tax=Mycobacterium lehmannii TaxID=2048550 RepID=A0A124EP53_9MYCO|nr:WhiB family transcriptional regulator [Mycobacterium lehmannii]KUI13390.1 hypothetical protein AU192_24730 [Mycobacterium lehmannii]
MSTADLPVMARLWRSRTPGDIEAGMTAAITAAPDLRGALCKGSDRWDWDPGEDPEPCAVRDSRLAAAAKTCTRCPVLQQCAAYLHGLPMEQRPPGVMAGELTLPPTERRRQRKRAAAAATRPRTPTGVPNTTPNPRQAATAAVSPEGVARAHQTA